MKTSNSKSKKERHAKEKVTFRSGKKEAETPPHDKAFIGIRFDFKTNLFFTVLALYLLFTTFFNINGSSVAMWNDFFNQKTDTQILFGTPKNIRVDEWAIHTPAILSQCNTKPPFSTENYSLGGHKAPLVMSVPVKHFSAFLRPQFWLFFIADKERAFAFYWNMKLVILVGGVFLLLMLILENNFVLSVFGALWVYFSSYLQWLYSSPAMWPPELVGCFALFTTAFIQCLISRRKMMIVVFSLIFLVSCFNFVVSLYPPHQVPLVYLSFCIILGILLPKFKTVISELLMDRFRLTCVILTLLLTAGLLLLFYLDTKQTLEVFADTVYPGKRRSAGGGISIAQIFNGFMGVFMTENNFPVIWDNVCESSNFFLFFPIPMMFLCWKWFQQKKVSALEAALAIYIAIILFWQIWGFPQPIAQLTLFDRVTERRVLLSLGIASIFWTCLFLHQIIKKKTLYTVKIKVAVTAIMLAGILLHSIYFNSVTGNFASVSQIIIVCVFVAAASFLLVSRQTLLFAGLILVPNIITFGLINPISIGLKPIINHPLYERIHGVVLREPDSKWVVYGNQLLANFTYAAGAKVFNGLKYIPNLEEMKELSSKSHDVEIYNRYGYIALAADNGSEISFSLSSSPDLYTISVDPQNDCWKRLNITYGMFPTDEGIDFYRYLGKP
jgi:hypothetical protein